jgi:NAD(P)-dependent dehydrogenase (short-subunit alcohol dehydrogenase family)
MRKALIAGLPLGKTFAVARALAASGMRVLVESRDQEELSALRIDGSISVHRLFPNRNASFYEVFEVMEAPAGDLAFVLFDEQ